MTAPWSPPRTKREPILGRNPVRDRDRFVREHLESVYPQFAEKRAKREKTRAILTKLGVVL